MSNEAVKPDRMTGVVILAKEEKDFGFIRVPILGVRDHYFNGESITEGPVGEKSSVSFVHVPKPSEKRDQAIDVRVIPKPTEVIG